MENNYVPEIYVGENGNWFVNGYDTGTIAQGEAGKDGITPHIGADGFWYIGEVNTGVKAQGEIGPKGDKGEAGAKGYAGETGPAGSKGDKGDPGTQGEKGNRGEKGKDGAQGIQGVAGPQGQTGATGPKGDIGPKGEKGDPGPSNIKNNLTTTEEGFALDARQGQILNSNFATWFRKGYVTSPTKSIPANGFTEINIAYMPPKGYELAMFNAVVTTYKAHANVYYSTETKSFVGAIWNETNTVFNSGCVVYVLVKKI